MGIYLIAINVITFLLFVIDKEKAKRGAWRISEKTLLTCALIGGSVGGLAGMYLVRHKTQKPMFTIGMPVILILQIVVAIYLLIG